MSSDGEDTEGAATNERDATPDATEFPIPAPSAIPTPEAIVGEDDATGSVVWHRKHLRTDDHLALSRAVARDDVVCPMFAFDPAFYGEAGLACDARIRFLHEAVTSLDRLYAAAPADATELSARPSPERVPAAHPLDSRDRQSTTGVDDLPSTLEPPESPGLTIAYGDPADVLSAFVDQGWRVLTMATPTSRYGKRRDDRVRAACGDAVTFLSGDGLVRDAEWSRSDWQSRVQEWLGDAQHAPGWTDRDATRVVLDTGVTPALIDAAFDVTPRKRKVPTGTHRAAATRLRAFVDRIRSYPSSISAPQDAREGTSGLSPYINFGLLSVRQVYQHVRGSAPDCRGREMFTSRLYWNLHYNQKLVDWPGWTERAVNPVLEGRNEDAHDQDLVEAWKQGRTGVPMVDASMRCLRETGWLNFRMRAMCASFFAHVLRQPWWIGADWYHHHLIDSDVAINYTQWQSQAGLVGKPSQRVYNPRKQVRDHDPEGEWITEWVPELAGLPSQFLDRPERAPLAVQEEAGVLIGEDYPRPVVDFEARREQFWREYERHRSAAARELRRPEIAKRASFSGGYAAAAAIAREHGTADDDSAQVSLADVGEDATPPPDADDPASDRGDRPTPESSAGATRTDAVTVPTGAGETAGEPSPEDRAAVATDPTAGTDDDGRDGHDSTNGASGDDSTNGASGDDSTNGASGEDPTDDDGDDGRDGGDSYDSTGGDDGDRTGDDREPDDDPEPGDDRGATSTGQTTIGNFD